MPKLLRSADLFLFTGTLISAATFVSFSFFNFDYPNSTFTGVNAINNKGQVVGSYSTSSSYGQGFVRNPDGSSETIVLPYSSTDSPASGINSEGEIVGSFYDPSTNAAQGYLRSAAGVYSIIADPVNPNNSGASGINDFGQIVGTYSDPVTNIVHGFYRDAQGTYQTIDDPNEAPGPDGLEFTQLNALNNAGQMVGIYTDSVGQHGFVYTLGGTFTTIDVPNAQAGTTWASGINNLGEIVGWYSDTSNVLHGFYRSANGLRYLTVNDPITTSGTRIGGINDHRQIAGSYTFSRGFIARPPQ